MEHKLKALDPYKRADADLIPHEAIKYCSNVISSHNLPIKKGIFPMHLKILYKTHMDKLGDMGNVSN